MAEVKEEFREPFAEIRETEAGARLIVELPGVPQDSIKMEVSRDLVTVVGKGSRGNFKTIQVMPSCGGTILGNHSTGSDCVGEGL